MTRRYHARRQSRRALLWRVFYGSGELVGQGSIVDVHKNGCRISGCMPVEVGSHLRLCIWPTDNPTDIVVAQGTVRWARGLEFGLLLDAHMPDLDELAHQLASVRDGASAACERSLQACRRRFRECAQLGEIIEEFGVLLVE